MDKDQRIAILVYSEDHPAAYPPEIAEATGSNYNDVIHVLREHKASQPRFKIAIETEFDSRESAQHMVDILNLDHQSISASIEDVTPCAFYVNGRNGHKHYCERQGPHKEHLVNILRRSYEYDKEGKYI